MTALDLYIGNGIIKKVVDNKNTTYKTAHPLTAPAPPAGKNEQARAATPGALLNQITSIAKEMVTMGWPNTIVLTYCIAQLMLESDWLTSAVGNEDNNYTGITFINKPYQKATRGRAKPARDGGGNYAHFANFREFLTDYKRILSLNKGQGRPIDSTTAQEFYTRLKANGYFKDPNYSTKFNRVLARITEALKYGEQQNKIFVDARNKGQTIFTADEKTGVTPGKQYDLEASINSMPAWEKWLFGILAGVVIIKIVS